MALTRNSPGCCGCNTSCSTTICVLSPCGPDGATAPSTGVTVTVSNSSGFSVSGVTPGGPNPLGCVTLTIPGTGKFTVATSGNARYNPTSGTFTLGCSDQLTINLEVAENFNCACFSNEPVSLNLLVTGGTGSATIPSSGTTNFTLTASVEAMTPPNFTSCNGETLTNTCTTGNATITVPFTFTRTCNDIQQGWVATTDCTINFSSGDGDDTEFNFYGADGVGGGGAEVWGTALSCMGFNSDGASDDPIFPVPQTVPIMFTVNFPPTGSTAGTAANNPPISSILITEVL
jgi:hypothetical protein